MMIIFKKKGQKFDQKDYDFFFHSIEYNLRESGLGDVSVNKKMKDFNKIMYDILLKIDISEKDTDKFNINKKLINKYFTCFQDNKDTKYLIFERYFTDFFNFCFELPLDNMVRDAINFNYGSS